MDARSTRHAAVAAITLALVGGSLAWRSAHRHRARPRRTSASTPTTLRGVELHVPRASGAIVVDAELEEPAWKDAARTGPLVDADGAPAHPYSDARLLWRDETLYLALYAADEDLRATHEQADGPLWLDDAFHVGLSTAGKTFSLDVSPLGTLTDGASTTGGPLDFSWSSGARVAVERDGTPNDPRDDDEEWVVELSVPLASLGADARPGTRLGLSLRRCDVPRNSPRVCASFGERAPGVVLVLD